MTKTFDGLTFDLPPTSSQIVELAHQHRKNLDEAIFHEEIHLGDYCLAQRKRVYDFTRQLDPQQREEFYQVYRLKSNGVITQVGSIYPNEVNMNSLNSFSNISIS